MGIIAGAATSHYERKQSTAIAILVKAIGFSESERNAFGTVLDLSPSRLCSYRLWQPTMTRDADIYVLDGESSVHWQDVSGFAKTAAHPFLWVGHNPPKNAAHSFLRPVRWMSVMDALEVVASSLDISMLPEAGGVVVDDGGGVDLDLNFDELDIDLDLSAPDDGLALPKTANWANSTGTSLPAMVDSGIMKASGAPELRTLMMSALMTASGAATPTAAGNPRTGFGEEGGVAGRRALIVGNSLYEGLFLRRRLMLQKIDQVDETASRRDARALARANAYDVAIVDIDLAGGDGWALAEELHSGANAVRQVIMISAKASALQSAKARMAGMALIGATPIDTAQLDRLLAKAAAA